MAWINEAVTIGGNPMPGWMINWRLRDGTWPDPYTEESGHLFPSWLEAIDALFQRIHEIWYDEI